MPRTWAPAVSFPALLISASAAVRGASGADWFKPHRPDVARWRRTQCGGPKGAADIPSRWAGSVSAASTPLPAYPRPQLVRGEAAPGQGPGALRDRGDPAVWANLNGLWEWQAGGPPRTAPPFGKTLSGAILVPFPVESCLSGVAPARSQDVAKEMWYRLLFDLPAAAAGTKTLLHFGAVDWQATVFVNGALMANHTGGYDGFSADISDALKPEGNELLLFVYDPSDTGAQPHGKQRISAISDPGGDTYTPSSGIWQTVWLERVPSRYVERLKLGQASTTTLTVEVELAGDPPPIQGIAESVTVSVQDPATGAVVATGTGSAGQQLSLEVPNAKLWSGPDSPALYDVRVSAGMDDVLAYFGLRTFALGSAGGVTRPLLNGKFTFLAGFLDQSFWPDGLYTAPSDEALEYDILATTMFGLNMIRLHQKVNPERWYYHADRHGVIVFQDMPQKYGHAHPDLIPYYNADLERMVAGRGNHPCIVQWTVFNEGDCWNVFGEDGVRRVVDRARHLDPTRLVDTDSGGDANNFHAGDVNDIHSYPDPQDVTPSQSQYAMVGEFGGLGAFVKGKEWVPGACYAYKKANSSAEQADLYVAMAKTLASRADHISASVYTQTTDVELECDGFLNYDRSNKFDEEQTAAIREANRELIHAAADAQPTLLAI